MASWVIKTTRLRQHGVMSVEYITVAVACLEVGVYNCVLVEKEEGKRRVTGLRVVNKQAENKPGQS